jgi:hypothetical protein
VVACRMKESTKLHHLAAALVSHRASSGSSATPRANAGPEISRSELVRKTPPQHLTKSSGPEKSNEL